MSFLFYMLIKSYNNMNYIETTIFNTAYGDLLIGSFENKLCVCDWYYRKLRTQIDNRIKAALNAEFTENESAIITETKKQLNEYFQAERKNFDIPLLLIGTDFQIKVWETLKKISYGETSTYLKLSALMGNTKAIRAVAGANGANAISIIVPCHRIIGSDGNLTGYAGGLNTKKKLLELEQKENNKQLSMSL